MYRFHSRLVRLSKLFCLSKQGKVTDNRKDANLLRSLFISCKLRIRNVLYYRPPVFSNQQSVEEQSLEYHYLFIFNY
jgi:hypothetical protein